MSPRPSDSLAIAIAQLNPIVGDIAGNAEKARRARAEAAREGADLVAFPELFLSGYPPEDLVLKPALQASCRAHIEELARETADGGPAVLIGTPWVEAGKLYNSYCLLADGEIAALRFKVDLPNYGVFDEKRVFVPGPLPGPINFRGIRLGIPVCEDIWAAEVVECLAETGAELMVVPNGSPYWREKDEVRLNIVLRASPRATYPSFTSIRWAGRMSSCSMAPPSASMPIVRWRSSSRRFAKWSRPYIGIARGTHGGAVMAPSTRWNRVTGRTTARACWGCATMRIKTALKESSSASRAASIPRWSRRCQSMRSVRSGCAASCCPIASPPRNPSMTPPKSRWHSGCRYEVVPIESAVRGLEEALAPAFQGQSADVTEENLQSRTRGTILMAISNKFGLMVVTTGNKSEMSVGYATLYGDMNGGFNPIKDLYKTQVYRLAQLRNSWKPEDALGPAGEVIPANVLTRAPTAELRENQTDQDTLPPYDVLDAILERLVEREEPIASIVEEGFDRETVMKVERMLNLAEYKRRQAAPGVKVTLKNFGRDRRYPIVNRFRDSGTPLPQPDLAARPVPQTSEAYDV